MSKLKAKQRSQRKIKTVTPALNKAEFFKAVVTLSKMLVSDNPAQDYNSTANLEYAGTQLIFHPKNGVRKHAESVREVTQELGQYLQNNYGVALAGGAGAWMQDVELHLQQQGVPQHLRVALGLLDYIGGRLMLLNGAVNFIKM
jgi:hypothetical protein